jgi:hypothetical protein
MGQAQERLGSGLESPLNRQTRMSALRLPPWHRCWRAQEAFVTCGGLVAFPPRILKGSGSLPVRIMASPMDGGRRTEARDMGVSSSFWTCSRTKNLTANGQQ